MGILDIVQINQNGILKINSVTHKKVEKRKQRNGIYREQAKSKNINCQM